VKERETVRSDRRLTTLSRPLRKKKRSSVMVMNLMARSESAKRKSKRSQTHSITSRSGTRTIETNSCRVLKERI
jgi:hypothetical protein